MTKPTLEDLEAMRQQYGIAQEEDAPLGAAGRPTYALLDDLGQVGMLEEVGMRLKRWALLRDVPIEYALALRDYLDGSKRRTQKGPNQ